MNNKINQNIRKQREMRRGGRRTATEAAVEQRQLGNSRDSDVSFASSRPSSVGMGRASVASDVYSDRSNQASAIRAINAFLSSQSFPTTLRTHPVPSLKDISETLKFLMSAVDFPCDARKWDDDLVFLLKSLHCPFKLTKSTLRAPNTPHNWPSVLAVIHWLVQLARYHHHLSSNSSSFLKANSMNSYAVESYRHYIRGEDDLVADLDANFLEKLEAEKSSVVEIIAASEKSATELEAKLEALRKGPSKKEALEKVKADLEEDANKFRIIIGEYTARNSEIERVLEEKHKELTVKQEERQRVCEENEGLKKRVELQSFNARDAERMKRELQAVDRDIADAEVARDAWEQKAWELNTQIRNQIHELQTLAMDCNQSFRRLKINIQYNLNEKGSTPAEVMGVDYKNMVKPALMSYADEINKNSMGRLEELISLQHQSSEIASKITNKETLLASLQSQIDENEEKINAVKKEIEDFSAKCDAEAKVMIKTIQKESLNLDVVEKEAAEVLKASELRLQEAVQKSEEEVQACAAQLFALIDSVSKQKEYMDTQISKIRNGVAEVATTVSDVYKGSFKMHLEA
ncbi:PREDICTED: kinetochore protein NDC80 homolog [Tarenaya hassleriana]|uniref:kinetochore protein NDC80 homolog n=1 Tax=Tarenaya hassleriana TaxID=28532 RepID=UPI00053C15F2|nr:PREDICTED: kinetochore protein NDC80 homolog [Tarenaya hassleriana]XP_010554442.1 PREDICTED: kinetochore protein NDC80 homolog [Tarenaya hassleriana]